MASMHPKEHTPINAAPDVVVVVVVGAAVLSAVGGGLEMR